MAYRIVNYIGFQVGWFASIGGAASGRPFLGPVVMGTVLALQLGWARKRTAEVALLLAAGAVGYVADSSLVLAGILGFAPSAGGWPCPLWMVMMWVGLAGTLHSSMAWLLRRPLLTAAFGAVSAPLAYGAGVKAGAAHFGVAPAVATIAVAVEWAVAMPVLIWLAELTRPDRPLAGQTSGGEAKNEVVP
jgi:hypothetical protein